MKQIVINNIGYEIIAKLQKYIYNWYSENGRFFPWRYTFDAYKVLVSEVLLQQTNAEKVVGAYNIIVKQYKTICDLADADIVFLRSLFKDLGLFYRADRLVDISRQITEKYKGKIPDKREDLLAIRGIGNYISNAVLCFGYNKPYAVVDTNVIRVFDRVLGFKSTHKRPRTDRRIWELAQILLPSENYVDYNYGLLDFASAVCRARKPVCSGCLMYVICNYSKNTANK